MKIALDFDSVLSDTMVLWVRKYNEKQGTKYTKQDIRSWEFWNDFDIKQAYAQDLFRESWEDWTQLPATEKDLNQKVAQLSKNNTIDVVTNVDESYLKYVVQWLHNEKIIVNDVKHAGSEKISQPYDLFIDDSPSLAEKANTNSKNCFLYDQKWNRHVPDSNKVTRINNLTEAINKIAKKNL